MIRLVSWNMNGRVALWNDVLAMRDKLGVSAALLQEAPRPPEALPILLDRETEWQTVGSGRSWRTAVAALDADIQFRPRPLSNIGNGNKTDLRVSRPGTLSIGEITIPETGEAITLVSMYSVWERPDAETGSPWIYSDASAHRLISDISALIGRESGHRIIAAGDLNLLFGYGDNGDKYWSGRYQTVFDRMEAIGLKFVGPQFPNGDQASPWPAELPEDSLNLPTYRWRRTKPETAVRQLDFVFASESIADRITTRALNSEDEWGDSDHCRVLIEVGVRHV